MKVSLIICTRNRARDLELALGDILPSVHGLEILEEVLVVDNGSSDGTRNAVTSLQGRWGKLRYTVCMEKGLSRARNHGISSSRGDVLVWTDDDVRVNPSWMKELIDPIVSGFCQCTVGRVEIAPHLVRKWMKGWHRPWLAENVRPTVPRLVGANMAITRRALEAAGGFDPELGAGALGFHEESDLGCNLGKMGMPTVYVDKAVVIHHFRTDRLARKSWIRTAEGAGASTAHVLRNRDAGTGHMNSARIAWHRLMLYCWRGLHPDRLFRREGIDHAEFHRIKTIACLRGMGLRRKTSPPSRGR